MPRAKLALILSLERLSKNGNIRFTIPQSTKSFSHTQNAFIFVDTLATTPNYGFELEQSFFEVIPSISNTILQLKFKTSCLAIFLPSRRPNTNRRMTRIRDTAGLTQRISSNNSILDTESCII